MKEKDSKQNLTSDASLVICSSLNQYSERKAHVRTQFYLHTSCPYRYGIVGVFAARVFDCIAKYLAENQFLCSDCLNYCIL